MQTTLGRPRRRLTLALLLATAFAAPEARAQTSASPTYQGFTQSGFIPFVGPNRVEVQIGGRTFQLTMDTGSTGLAITADSIPGYSLEMAARYPIGWEFLSSDDLLWVGHLIPMDIVFPDGRGGSVTATVPVLAVEREANCPGYVQGPACPGVALRRAAPRIRYMGVGFGREHDHQPDATPNRNPFLNITRMGARPVQPGAMRSGYVITGGGVHVGLTPANTAGFGFARLALQPGFQDPRDWGAASMCVSVNRSACAPGSLLTDTGIDYMFLTLPPTVAVDSVVAGGRARLADSSRVTVRIPAAGEAVATYTFTIGRGDAAAPCSVALTARNDTAFVNTSNRFFRKFDLLFDADGGWFGLRPAAPAREPEPPCK